MSTIKIKTADLTGAALDWAVAKCEDFDTRNNYRVWVTQGNGQVVFDCCADDWEHAYEQAHDAYPDDHVAAAEPLENYSPSTDWSQGGPIIEREWVEVVPWPNEHHEELRWRATQHDMPHAISMTGPTPLIAAMRCFVASRLGDEVKLPVSLS